MRVKYGIDPTGIDVHLGHTVPLRKLRQFQDLGHTAVIIIGNYTALVGDPSGRDETRAALTEEQVEANARDYLKQVGRIIDLDRAEVHHNGDWFSKWSFLDVLDLMRHMTLGQITAREDFAKRIAAEKPVYLHECLYPLMQGWDSVEIRADVELGGTEQLFSLLVARDLQQSRGQEPQVAMTMPILVGTDGVRRMGKSLGNYIGVAESRREPVRQGDEHPRRADAAVLHPADRPAAATRSTRCWRPGSTRGTPRRSSARRSSPSITAREAADRAAAEFRRRASGEDPDEIPDVTLSADKLDAEGRIAAPRLIKELGLEIEHLERPPGDRAGGLQRRARTARSITDPKALDRRLRRLDRPGRQAQDRTGSGWSELPATSNPDIDARVTEHGPARFRPHRLRDDRRVSHPGDQRDPGRPRRRRLQPDPGQRREDRRHGRAATARSTTTWTRCSRIPGLDVVCVCTPSGAHLEPAVAGGQGGQARRRREAAGDHPAALRRDHRRLRRGRRPALHDLPFAVHARPTSALKEAIDGGRFGRLTLGDTYVKWWRTQEYYDSGGWRGTWDLDGGGALMNQAIHNVDLLYWLMGDVDSIVAQTATLAHDRIEVEDTAVAGLRFKNGALGVIEAATSAYPGLLKRTEIHGDRGSARVEQDDITLWEFQEKVPSDNEIFAAMAAPAGFKAGASDPRGITHVGHRDQLADFLQAIDEGRAPLVDGREGRKSVEIIRAIYQSAQTGQVVKLPLVEEVA